LNVSKWLNSITILTTDANAITTINAFPFVLSTGPIAARSIENGRPSFNKIELENIVAELPVQRVEQVTSDFFDYGANSYREIHLQNGEFLHNIGLRGQGMQIAMLDAGFFNYTSLKAFDSVNINGQVLNTWDFVARESSVVEDNSHGMLCFSTIAANIPGQFVGKAPKANFYLFRTEDAVPEDPIEEHNWTCAAERADSCGADIISTSLGYSTFDNAVFNHTYNDMNGNTTMCAIAADLAAKKGLLVFVANGNSGTSTWHYLNTPADADSVVAVGSVDTLGVVAANSSYGPSSDGQVKPDIASVGRNAIVQNTNNTIGTASGTSLACPNMAGLGTCLWQGFPEFNSMKIVRAMQQAGNIFTTPNDRIGYGIPNMKTAFTNLLVDFATSNASVNSCSVTINWTSKDIAAMKYEIERKAPGDPAYSKIGELNPVAGTLLANHTYQFINNLVNITAGTVSYRIRQIIDTATTTFTAAYIDTASVNIASGCTATGLGNPTITKDKITLLPNPAPGNAILVVDTRYAVNNMPIAVYDMKGSLMMQLHFSKGANTTNIELPTEKLAKGKYIIRVYNNQKLIGTAELLKL